MHKHTHTHTLSLSLFNTRANVAGRILWVRHLLKMIELPMYKFRQHAALMISRDSKSIIKKYNQIAQAFVAYEVRSSAQRTLMTNAHLPLP